MAESQVGADAAEANNHHRQARAKKITTITTGTSIGTSASTRGRSQSKRADSRFDRRKQSVKVGQRRRQQNYGGSRQKDERVRRHRQQGRFGINTGNRHQGERTRIQQQRRRIRNQGGSGTLKRERWLHAPATITTRQERRASDQSNAEDELQRRAEDELQRRITARRRRPTTARDQDGEETRSSKRKGGQLQKLQQRTAESVASFISESRASGSRLQGWKSRALQQGGELRRKFMPCLPSRVILQRGTG